VSEAGVYLDALYDLTGLIVGEAFNSFSQVRIAGKPKTVKSTTETNSDGTAKEKEVDGQAEVGVGIGMNISKITTINANTIDGRITAGQLTLNAANAMAISPNFSEASN
jgi:hypothetical protein